MNAQTFIEALHAIEQRRDYSLMLSLYDEDAETQGPSDPRPYRGREGAERFWRAYRAAFSSVRSELRTVVEDDTHAILEWRSEGESAHGAPFTYEGVSVVDFSDEGIRRFRAYFDPGRLQQALSGSLTPAALEADETSPTGDATAPSGA